MNLITSGSTVDPYNSYTTLISYTENFIVFPTLTGWKYMPRQKFDRQNLKVSKKGVTFNA